MSTLCLRDTSTNMTLVRHTRRIPKNQRSFELHIGRSRPHSRSLIFGSVADPENLRLLHKPSSRYNNPPPRHAHERAPPIPHGIDETALHVGQSVLCRLTRPRRYLPAHVPLSAYVLPTVSAAVGDCRCFLPHLGWHSVHVQQH